MTDVVVRPIFVDEVGRFNAALTEHHWLGHRLVLDGAGTTADQFGVATRRLRNKGSGMCLTAPSAFTTLRQRPCAAGDRTQDWQEYAEFCQEIAGHFVHHRPLDEEGVDSSGRADVVAAMKARGITVDDALWGASPDSGSTCAQCAGPSGPKSCAPQSCSPGS